MKLCKNCGAPIGNAMWKCCEAMTPGLGAARSDADSVPCSAWLEEGAAHDYTADDQIKLGWDELRGMQERARHYANLATATKGERRMAANLLKCCEWIEAEGRSVETERRCSSTDQDQL